jgi:DNA replication protein DnaC
LVRLEGAVAKRASQEPPSAEDQNRDKVYHAVQAVIEGRPVANNLTPVEIAEVGGYLDTLACFADSMGRSPSETLWQFLGGRGHSGGEFDWSFNPAISRVQIETLATCDFVRRRQNLVFVGQSGVGKSFLIQSIGQAACTLGYRVCYLTSGTLLEDLTAALADQTIHDRVRHYARFDLLIIDEFGFDRIERSLCPQAASLWYKIIDARSQRGSTALVTNIDFEAWTDYLGDAPLAMALLDRVVDGATIVKLKGKSYRVHRGPEKPQAD